MERLTAFGLFWTPEIQRFCKLIQSALKNEHASVVFAGRPRAGKSQAIVYAGLRFVADFVKSAVVVSSSCVNGKKFSSKAFLLNGLYRINHPNPTGHIDSMREAFANGVLALCEREGANTIVFMVDEAHALGLAGCFELIAITNIWSTSWSEC